MSPPRRAITDPWFCYEQPRFFQLLGAVPRKERWSIITALREAELAVLEAAPIASYGRELAERMALAPMLEGVDLEALAARCVNAMFKRNMHTTSIFAELAAGGEVGDVVEADSLRPFLAARDRSGPMAVLPVHTGAIEAGIAALSLHVPVTLVVSQGAQVPEVVDERYTDLIGPFDLEILRAPSPTVLLKCVKAIRRQRCVVFPPEFTSKDDDSVVALEVAGRMVGVPDGYVRFAHRLGIPLMVVTFEQTPDLGYRFNWHGPFAAEDPAAMRPGQVPRAVDAVFEVVAEVLRTQPHDWEGWWMYDRMVADGERILCARSA